MRAGKAGEAVVDVTAADVMVLDGDGPERTLDQAAAGKTLLVP